MQIIKAHNAIPLFLRFYARCFNFPYEEMGYELQYLLRQIEREELEGDDFSHLEQVLNIVNHYQGEEIKDLRDNFVALFSLWENTQPVCPMIASDFMEAIKRDYNADEFVDRLLESGLSVNPEDALDSIVNYLDYFAWLFEQPVDGEHNQELIWFYENHVLAWIPLFCELLFDSGNISFYKEVALGLKEFVLRFWNE